MNSYPRFFPTLYSSNPPPDIPKEETRLVRDFNLLFVPIQRINRTPPAPSKAKRYGTKYSNMYIHQPTFSERFTNKRLIGRGSFWEVYLALDTKDNVEKVLKISTRPRVKKSYQREFKISETIKDDTYLALMSETISERGMYYGVMDLYRCSVWDFMVRKSMTEDEIIYVSWAVLHALKTLNRLGFVHLDVKPENMFIARDGKVKLGDFNTSCQIGVVRDIDEMGESSYLAPEVLQGIVTPQADIFSLGISMFEMSSQKKFPIYDSTFDIKDEHSLKLIGHSVIKDIFVFMTNLAWKERFCADEFLEFSVFQSIPLYSIQL
ncbi:Membrane-associated tyrosine-and threonine-specific CDC2-inhibitory kinase [Entamoeba marina]